MTMQEITDFLDKKIAADENEVRITFYEMRVKYNLSEAETKTFLTLCETRFKNLGYQVFYTGEKFLYNNATRTVQDNELIIAIKNKTI